ncbi:MAG: penicillin-binding protein 2 [Lentisphaeria bacterium]|nr:penicillin-binding protein 2 [Lentisphaeria bacterium]
MKFKQEVVRTLLATLLPAASLVLLCAHLYRLQVTRHDELLKKAQAKYTTSRAEKGRRGRIFDVGGNMLAADMVFRDVLAEPRRFTKPRSEYVEILAETLGMPRVEVIRTLNRAGKTITYNGRSVVLREVSVMKGVEITRAEELRVLLQKKRMRGVRCVERSRRSYPKDSLLANFLGFLDSGGEGASGVEQMMDSCLQPTSGRDYYERDRRGNPLPRGLHREAENVRDGFDVHLTIDETVQLFVEEELQALVEEFEPRAAYAVMADPKTGACMALAQWPTFDPNNRGTMEDPDCWRNRILTDGFEPGSVMKAVSISGALDYGVVRLSEVFDCKKGRWLYGGRILHDSHKFGNLAVWEVVQHSSNIGTAQIALRMGSGRLYQTFLRFGFGRPTDLGKVTFSPPLETEVGFGREASGILRPAHSWYPVAMTRLPIGQGILVTPLQLVQAYCALANDGIMMQPYIIDRVVDPVTGQNHVCPPRVKCRAVRPWAAREMVKALKLVTQKEGTAPKACVPGYEVAGKTGTAQKWIRDSTLRAKGYYSHKEYVSSFIGFVPADNPEFVLLVVADTPTKGGHYGGTVAAPTFRRISEKTLGYLPVSLARSGAAVRSEKGGSRVGIDVVRVLDGAE